MLADGLLRSVGSGIAKQTYHDVVNTEFQDEAWRREAHTWKLIALRKISAVHLPVTCRNFTNKYLP
jgi:hypothetical protein